MPHVPRGPRPEHRPPPPRDPAGRADAPEPDPTGRAERHRFGLARIDMKTWDVDPIDIYNHFRDEEATVDEHTGAVVPARPTTHQQP